MAERGTHLNFAGNSREHLETETPAFGTTTLLLLAGLRLGGSILTAWSRPDTLVLGDGVAQ
jgi:hypothetical protein